MKSTIFLNIFFVMGFICYFTELIISIRLSRRVVKNKKNPEAVKKPHGFRLWKAQVVVLLLCYVTLILCIIFSGKLTGMEGIQKFLTVLRLVGLYSIIPPNPLIILSVFVYYRNQSLL